VTRDVESQAFQIFASVRQRLGADFWKQRGRVAEACTMANGEVWLQSDDEFFWFHPGTAEPMRGSLKDGEVEFGWITPRGEWLKGTVPQLVASVDYGSLN
jgi:hypothetical protein